MLNKKEAIKYITQLAVDSYEIDGEDIKELIEQLEREGIIKLIW